MHEGLQQHAARKDVRAAPTVPVRDAADPAAARTELLRPVAVEHGVVVEKCDKERGEVEQGADHGRGSSARGPARVRRLSGSTAVTGQWDDQVFLLHCIRIHIPDDDAAAPATNTVPQ
eukprot:COSAG05_NODE_4442_length_1511_cov_1.296322_3_plen_118_part_00